MATAIIEYQGQLRTQCTHLQSHTSITTDAPTDNYGKGEAFSPTDLLATSLISCMVTTMGITAQKHGIPFEKASGEMQKIMANNPRRVSAIVVTLSMPNALTVEHREMLETAAIECPVARSLHPDIEQKVTFEYIKQVDVIT